MTKTVLVCGAGGFIGTHLVRSLKQQGYYVIGADLKYPQFETTVADEFYIIDLRKQQDVDHLIKPGIDTVYQLAADMGGAGYIFTGKNDADIMHSSASININIISSMRKAGVKNVFFTSSACAYPAHNQEDPTNILISEDSVYPANPDSEYGWEKIFSERVYLNHARNHDFRVRIARLHNVFGPLGAWDNGREKAPAALCRKIALSNGTIEIWGNGKQLRSFMYIDQCIEGIHRLQDSSYLLPVNLGSARTISISELAELVAKVAGKKISIKYIAGPVGVNARTSDNRLIKQILQWEPVDDLEYGLEQTYHWIDQQIKGNA
jgi:GDP-D-mannose 3',5'-epimerase